MKNMEDQRTDVTIWPPRIHYGQNYKVITALVAKTRRLYTNANECGSVFGLTTPFLFRALSLFPFRRAQKAE